MLRAPHIHIQIHLDVLVAEPSAGDVAVQADVVVSRVVRGECEAALGGSAGVDDGVAGSEFLRRQRCGRGRGAGREWRDGWGTKDGICGVLWYTRAGPSGAGGRMGEDNETTSRIDVPIQ